MLWSFTILLHLQMQLTKYLFSSFVHLKYIKIVFLKVSFFTTKPKALWKCIKTLRWMPPFFPDRNSTNWKSGFESDFSRKTFPFCQKSSSGFQDPVHPRERSNRSASKLRIWKHFPRLRKRSVRCCNKMQSIINEITGQRLWDRCQIKSGRKYMNPCELLWF